MTMWGLREDLRKRFVKAETTLFKLRYETEDTVERATFLNSRNFDWQQVCAELTANCLRLDGRHSTGFT